MLRKGFAPLLSIIGIFILVSVTGVSLYLSQKIVSKSENKPAPTSRSINQNIDAASPIPSPSLAPSPTTATSDPLNIIPLQLNYSPKSDWKVVVAKDGSSKIDFPKDYPLSVTSYDDKIACHPLTASEIQARKKWTVEDFKTTIAVYGFKLNGQTFDDAVHNPDKLRINGEKIWYGGTNAPSGMVSLGEKRITSNGKPAIYQLFRWDVRGPFGPLYYHRLYLQKGDNFSALQIFVTEPFNNNHSDEILGILASLR